MVEEDCKGFGSSFGSFFEKLGCTTSQQQSNNYVNSLSKQVLNTDWAENG